jgi:hypothetical protein
MDTEIEFPFWICRRPVRGLKHVMICVDGSESALRTLDHVAFMVAREDQHRITLLHVNDGSRPGGDPLFEDAHRKLMEVGIEPDRIETTVVYGTNVAGAIQAEASRGSYAVVAVGRRGVKSDPPFPARFMGSTSLELLRNLEESTLWVSR